MVRKIGSCSGIFLNKMPRALDASQAGGTTRDVPAGDICGIPAAAQSYVLSATVVPVGPLGYPRLWAQGQSQPAVHKLPVVVCAETEPQNQPE